MRYGFKKEGFLRLECTFGGQKAGFKDLGCWVLGVGFWVLGCLFFGLESGLLLLRLRRREHKPMSTKPGVRFGFLGVETEYL